MTTIVVAAAVMQRGDAFLVTRRQTGVHLEGCWEFPGGKCESGETLHACLARELREEIGLVARPGDELFTTTHTYPGRTVELHFLRCEASDEPVPQLGQEMRWVPRLELGTLRFPPADTELVRILMQQV